MKQFLVFVLLALFAAGCGGSDDPFADLDPVRAIEQLDEQGRPYLSPWDVDPAVADLQQRAVDAGLPVEVTGVYDDETLAVVLAFQYSQDLVPDGIIGPNTWDALDNPQELPENIEALTLVEIAEVAIESPSDAQQMLTDLGLPPPVSPSGTSAGSAPPSGDTSSPAVTAVVYLGEQQMELIDAGGNVTHRFPVSSGRDGLTPIGNFKVQSKSELAYSATDYPNITMKWMTRFNGGIGFHGIPVENGEQLDTPLGQAPVSAGCIRMDDADAKVVYDLLPVGANVIVQA
ncbi:MAG: L,D-transpeptidase family protein [Acidimicrobiia bacterium]|nr:L,D-transpeptidase family protein [Acidimicrobiia bacterium]